MPKKEIVLAEAEEEKEGFSSTGLKKPVYAGSMFLSAVGILIALILVFVINDALDKTHASINTNIDGIVALLDDTGQTISALGFELSALNATFDDINSSVSSLSDGMSGVGTTMKHFGATLSQINIPGFSLSQYGVQMNLSGDEIIEGAGSLKQVSSLEEHRRNLAGLKASVSSVGMDIANQRAKVADTKQSISDVIGLIKLANILVFIMFVVMFAVLILNSAAGFL